MVLRHAHDGVDRLVVDVGRQDQLSRAPFDLEGRLYEDGRRVANYDAVVGVFREGGVREELDPVGVEVELRAKGAGVGDEVAALSGVDAVILEELVEGIRPREDTDALALQEAMPSLGPQGPGLAGNASLEDGRGGHPQRLDLDAVADLVLGRVLEVEHLLCAVAVIGVQVGEGDDVDLPVVTQALPQLGLQVAAPVRGIALAVHVGEVEEGAAAILQLDEAAVGVADVEEADDVH